MKRSIRVAICDDEALSATNLELGLRKYERETGEKFEIKKFDDGIAFMKGYKCQYDIVLLDIMMPVTNGIEVAEYIRKRDNKVIILFITSKDSFMLEGYSLDIFNYIIKPVNYVKFAETISKAISKLEETEEKYIMVKNDNGLFKIYAREIRYIETYERKLRIHTGGGEILCYKKMKELEEILDPEKFFRCHSGYIVNLFYVKEVKGGEVILRTGEEILVSQNKKSSFIEALSVYLGENL